MDGRSAPRFTACFLKRPVRITQARTPRAPRRIPGKKPARNTPGGNGLLDIDACGFDESIPDARTVGEEVLVDDVVTVVALDEVEDFAGDDEAVPVGVVDEVEDFAEGVGVLFEEVDDVADVLEDTTVEVDGDEGIVEVDVEDIAEFAGAEIAFAPFS
jgi:hypothetical protein